MNNSLHKRLHTAKYQINQPIGYNNNDNKNSSRRSVKNNTSNINLLSLQSNAQCEVEDIERSTAKGSNTLSSTKFSANDRLKKYRDNLNHRKNEIVKVHQVFEVPVSRNKPDEQKRLSSHSNLKTESISILGKRVVDQIKDKKDTDQEVANKKRKIIESSQQYDIKENIQQKQSHLDGNKMLYLNTSIQDACGYDDDCDMEWSPIDQEEAVSSVSIMGFFH